MLFDSAHTDELKAWLATELEPICDADPEVLSDYVMALLRRDVPDSELAKSMREQLIDFLEAETNPFVDRVFAALSSKSYLPESARQPPAPTTTTTTTPSSSNPTSNLPSNPLNSTDNSRKRKPEDDANDTSPKISKILTLDESIKAQSSLPSHPGNRGHGSFHKTDGGRPPLGTNVIWGQGDIQLKKGQCIDYHLKGFCSRGDSCQYEHAPNLLGGNKQPSNGSNPFVSSMSGGGIRMGASSPTPGSSFGNGLPNTPGNFNPRNGRTASPAGGGGGMNNGDSELASRMGVRARPPHQIQHQQQHHHQQPPFPFQQPQQPMHMMMGGGPPPMQNGMPPQGMMFPQQGMPPGGFDGNGAWRGGMSGGGGGNHNSRGGGGGSSNRGRGGGTGQFRNQGQKSDTTLVLENVPSENLDLVQVNEYFKKFGTITNIQIDAPNKKALVSFAKPSQATEAHSSPEVIFGNRFVKCYFQRLDDTSKPFQQHQHQQPPQQQQPKIPHGAVAPPPKSSFIPGQTSHVYVAPGASVPSSSTTNGTSTSNAEEKKKLIQERDSKQKELESLLNEQKSLFTKIGAATSAEEKKSVMTRLRSLDKETKELKEKVQKAIDSVNNFKEVSSTVTSKYQQEEEKKKELREQKERERLDRELDLHAQAPKDGSSKEEELKETLRRLQAEATSIGLDSNGNPTSSTSSRGGRGGFRGGRGGSMRLDNRTTRLSVKGLKKEDEGKREQLKEHFKQFGDVESFEDEPSDEQSQEAPGLIVVYKARPSGEAALRQGNEIPEIGQVKLSWSNAPSLPNSQTPTSSQSQNNQQEDQSNGKKDEE